MTARTTGQARASRLPKALLLTPLMLAAHGVAALVFVGFMCKVVPSYAKIFADFDLELPAMTQLVIQLSYLTLSYWYLLMLAVIVLDGALLFVLNLSPPWLAWVKWVWFGLFPLIVLVGIGLAMFALSVPLAEMGSALS